MKKLSIFNFHLLILLIAAFVAACDKKEQDPFTGKDSYITAFSLQQGEAVFAAAIAGNVITITAPEGFSLTQAKAAVKLSENASIYPNPGAISGWDNEQQFVVTAHNGAKSTYKYTVERSGIAHNGTVILETQADVDAFGAQGVTFIDGNLTIGRTAGTDSITSLAPLASLKEVVYAFTLQPTCAITGLEGLENLERVGGTLQFGGTATATALKRLETLALPALESAGGIILQNTVTIIVYLPELASISKQFSLSCPLFQLQLPNLQTAGGTFTLTTSSGSVTSLDKVYLPALEEAGGITISAFPNVTKVDFPQLKKSAGLSCTSMGKLSIVYAPALEEVTRRIYLYGLAALTELELPALKQAGEIYIGSCSQLRVLEFPELTSINALNLQSPPVISLAGFSSLQTAGSVTLYNLKELNKVEWPASVQRINYFTIQNISGTPAPSEINVKGINIGTLNLMGNATATGKLIGDEVFSGSLFINMTNASPYPDKFPQLEGFSEVDSLNVSPLGARKVHIRGIRKVRRGFYTGTGYSGYPYEFSIPDLEEVGGDVRIWFPYMINTPATFTAVTFDKLARVGGNFTLDVNTKTADTLHFPELAAVGGNFILSSGYDANYSSYAYKGFKIMRFPKLATVGGKLTLRAGPSSSNKNKRLENLDGFKALTHVGSITLTRQAALVNYSGLEELFKTLPAEGWITPTNNSYNPTYQDLKGRQWSKP